MDHPSPAVASPSGGPLNVAILGSTGSVGRSTLEVVAASGGRLVPHLLAAHRNVGLLVEQARAVHPRHVVVIDAEAAAGLDGSALPPGTRLWVGPEPLDDLVQAAEVDRVVAAIAGAAGLRSTWAAVAAGKTVALANKETLVMAGPLVMRLAARSGATILPVDSEHSAIHQALRAGAPAEVAR
ncbi:MAG: 1-deoxy-D-xylulose-5-phosphate reductoisomerase, partial [Planctomycetia bacterium]|nr:1-deoxy-D-xylulose-5-phosphate reductoisomerase [Planctomycetia bacterium]